MNISELLAKQAVSGQGVTNLEPGRLAPETLGFVELNPSAAAIETATQLTEAEPTAVIQALPLLSEIAQHQRRQEATQAWLALIASGDYTQALQDYRSEIVRFVEDELDPNELLGVAEHFLLQQSYCEANELLETAQTQEPILTEPSAASRLRLLRFICSSITGSNSTVDSELPLPELWSIAQQHSRQIRSLLLDSFVTKAIGEMACGRRKAAAAILNGLAAKEQHQDPAHDNFIDVLRQVCDYGTWKSVQGHLAKTTRRNPNVVYKKKFACAIDSIGVYGNGQVIVIHGWHVSDPSSVLSISLHHKRCLLTAHPSFVHRYERPDLAPIARQYNLNEQAPFGFTCTFLPESNNQSSPDWNETEACDIILCTETSSAVLSSKPIFKELTLGDIRTIIGMLIDDNLKLKSYLSAQRLKEIWSEQIEARSNEDAEHYFFGSRDNQPDLSILIPLYGRIDFMEFQLHWFFSQQKRHKTFRHRYQIIYCLDDPANKENLLRLASKCASLYNIPFEIVINSKNLGYAASNNVAARYARAKTLLLMNSDVLPRDHDAIDILLNAYHSLPANKGVLGAKLLYPSNDIQHVGMTFYKDSSLPGILSHCWLNEHPHKHIKHTSNPTLQTGIIETEAATAACLLISKDIFDELEGFRLDYISGDFEDSDLCLRLRQLGRSVLVCLDAVFFHLERQSMVLQAGHGQQALKLVAFNAYTHHERHSAAINVIKSKLQA